MNLHVLNPNFIFDVDFLNSCKKARLRITCFRLLLKYAWKKICSGICCNSFLSELNERLIFLIREL
jgi:hypothetical protein